MLCPPLIPCHEMTKPNLRPARAFRFLRRVCFLLAIGVASSTFAPRDAHAITGPGGHSFGLGLQLGIPLGITGKVFIGGPAAIQFGLGGIFPFGGLGGWADIVFHFVQFNNGRQDLLKLSLYFGPGVQLGIAGPFYYDNYEKAGRRYNYFNSPFSLGIRVPLGFAIHWQKIPMDTYIEIAPVVYVLPGVFVVGEAAIGARYYF